MQRRRRTRHFREGEADTIEAGAVDDWRSHWALRYLQISPSYHRVTQALNGRSADALGVQQSLPRVVETYHALGPLSGIGQLEWQFRLRHASSIKKQALSPRLLKIMDAASYRTTRQQRQLAEELAAQQRQLSELGGTHRLALLAVPLVGTSKSVLEAIKALLAEVDIEPTPPSDVKPFSILKNKIRRNTVESAYQVLRVRALHPDSPLFVIGNIAGVSPENETSPAIKRSHEDAQARRLMEILTSRQLHRALLLAENAALGMFPSLDPLPGSMRRASFDLSYTAEIITGDSNTSA